MLRKILVFLAIILIISPALANASEVYRSINDNIKIKDPYMDLKSFSYYVAETQRWSLIISNDTSVTRKKIEGRSIKEMLDNYCKDSEFGWRFVKDCLYIANERELSSFFKQLPALEMQLPEGVKEATYSGYFRNIELSMLCVLLSSVSNVKITVANGFDTNVMMRVNGMNWKNVLLAVVHLNRYKLNISDFSIVISPEN